MFGGRTSVAFAARNGPVVNFPPGFLRSPESMHKKSGHFPVWKVWKKFFLFVSMEKENTFPDLVF